MKILEITRKSIDYEFRLLEQCRVIEVSKGGHFTYEIRWKTSFFQCSCPGARYHGKCWHCTMIGALKKQVTINEPWAEWAEEAGRMMYERMG